MPVFSLRSADYKPPGAQTFYRKLYGGDLLGDGHYEVAPPSIHRTGKPYQWRIPLGETIPHAILGSLGLDLPNNETQVIRSSRICPVFHSGDVESFVAAAIQAIQPTGPGQRNARLFDFARQLKSHSDLADQTAEQLQLIVRKWWRRASPVVRTQDFAETFSDFRRAWAEIRWPAGTGSFQAALQRAQAGPELDEAKQFRKPFMRRLVALCRELQRENGDQPFFLACRDAAAAVGLEGDGSHVTAWRGLERICHTEPPVLQKVSSGTKGTRGGKANEYRWLGDLSNTGSLAA
jgi:hypothetical protein